MQIEIVNKFLEQCFSHTPRNLKNGTEKKDKKE